MLGALPARASIALPAISAGPATVTGESAVRPVYWVWHGRHWHHRRWAYRNGRHFWTYY